MKFGPETVGNINRLRRGITLKLFSSIIRDTPVLTGRLRANWQISENAPILSSTDKTDRSGGQTIAALSAPIEKSTGDTEMFLSNNLPYAAKIEFDGWSKVKAPEGMVRKNVVRFGRLISIEASKQK